MRPALAVHDEPAGGDWSRPVRWFEAIAIAAAVLVFAGVATFAERPQFVPRLEIANPTAFDLDVEATTSKHDGWMSVGIARRSSTTVAQEIYDIGESWVFRFHAQGKSSDEVVVTRRDLVESGWVLSVPSSVGDELRARGASAPP